MNISEIKFSNPSLGIMTHIVMDSISNNVSIHVKESISEVAAKINECACD